MADDYEYEENDDFDDDEPLDEVADNQGDDERIDLLNQGNENALRVEPEKRITTPFMTKYERARVLGTRALQISM
jgi:DNA-directed RNA polymerase I, II, and III subunit RPABC2